MASAERITPVEKVINLLDDLQKKVEKEASDEAVTYEAFACFCRDTTKAKSASIMDGQAKIDELSANIEAAAASKAEKESELADREKQHEELSSELREVTAMCLKEMTEFEAAFADLAKAVNSLDKALQAMRESKPAALLSLRESVRESLALADALGLFRTAKEQAFLQQGVDPSNPEYKYHSDEIISTLEKLHQDFSTKKSNTQAESDAAKTKCQGLKKSLTDKMEENDAAMGTLRTDIDSLRGRIASDRQLLVDAESVLKDDQLYMKDLTERCEARAVEWDQRAKARADEIKALAEALAILRDGRQGEKSVQELDEAVNNRTVLLQLGARGTHRAAAGAQPWDAERAARRAVREAEAQHAAQSGGARSRGLRGGRQASAVLAPSTAGAAGSFVEQRAAMVLHREGERLNSRMLSSLAAEIAADPFGKVKQLIQQLIERLLQEATQEATKKGFCDEELNTTIQKRNFRIADAKKLASEVGELEAKKASLEQEIPELEEQIDDARGTLNQTAVDRETQKGENLATIATAKEGVQAVGEAISILKAYYKEAAKASFLQASPVDEDTQGPGFQGTYKGQQDGAKGVISLLEVIKSDFERTVRKTKQEEAEAAAEFVQFDRATRTDIASKETDVERKQEDLVSTADHLTQTLADLKSAQDLVDAALKTIEELKPMCIDTGMSYDERVKKREEEIAALTKALCYLGPDPTKSDQCD